MARRYYPEPGRQQYMPPVYRKRRIAHGPSKNELRSARHERVDAEKSRSGTLRQRFPQVTRLQLDLSLQATSGAILEKVLRDVNLDEPLQLDIECPGGCGGGTFLLTNAVENLLNSPTDIKEGLAICQMVSYADPNLPCGTKLFFKISAQQNRPSPSV